MTAKDFSAETIRTVLDYDPQTGHLTWKAKGWKHSAGQRAGGLGHSAGYRCLQVNGKKVLEHRLIYFIVTGEWPNVIDHINGDRMDNRWSNLRNVSHTTNMQNIRRPQVNNKTGVLGVCWSEEKQKFIVRIHANGRIHNIGRFTDLEKAGQAYIAAKRRLHDGFTL